MPAPISQPPSLRLGQFADRIRSEMIPLVKPFCYYSAAAALTDDDRREYLDEPVAALPPSIAARLPEISILLVPYLRKDDLAKAPTTAEPLVATHKPKDADSISYGLSVSGASAVLAFATKDTEVADCHYRFYRAIAEMVAGKNGKDIPPAFIELLREEIQRGAHGEVDEIAWRMKTELDDKDRESVRPTKRFREYIRQSFIDTLTLYMHGICCDIDVETGPRQLPSNLLRKRLKFLKETYPAPHGYAVFPEDL